MRGTSLFKDEKIQNIIDFIIVNCVGQALMTRILLPHFMVRPQRSAIIDISSTSSVRPLGFYIPYAQTKAFNRFFSEGIRQES
jgi:short-subunit dehydrogenase